MIESSQAILSIAVLLINEEDDIPEQLQEIQRMDRPEHVFKKLKEF